MKKRGRPSLISLPKKQGPTKNQVGNAVDAFLKKGGKITKIKNTYKNEEEKVFNHVERMI